MPACPLPSSGTGHCLLRQWRDSGGVGNTLRLQPDHLPLSPSILSQTFFELLHSAVFVSPSPCMAFMGRQGMVSGHGRAGCPMYMHYITRRLMILRRRAHMQHRQWPDQEKCASSPSLVPVAACIYAVASQCQAIEPVRVPATNTPV